MLTRGLGEQDSIFNVFDPDMKAADLAAGRTAAVSDGVSLQWYKISTINNGEGLLLNNGKYANPVISPITNRILSKDVSTPHTLTNEDSGYILKFNDAGTAVLNIPDGLDYTVSGGGISVISLNLGGGGVQLTNTGAETTRGSTLLIVTTGYLATTKISPLVWQSSERS